VHNIKLWALGWFNIETDLSIGELLDKIVQNLPYRDDSSAIDKKCVTTLSTVITIQDIVITSPENGRLVRDGQQRSKRCQHLVERYNDMVNRITI
jgi:hypothetical protein